MSNLKKVFWYFLIFAVLAGCAYYVFRGGDDGVVAVDSGQRIMMGTFVRIIAVGENEKRAREAMEAGFKAIGKVDSLMSTYKQDSEISKLNREGHEGAVQVDEWVFEVIRKSVYYSELSNGAFDVTVGPLVDLWHEAGEKGELASEEAIAETRARVGYEKLKLDEDAGTVAFEVEGMEVDLGGIAKGFAIDMAVKSIMENGGAGGMVDAGGDIRCFGVKMPGKVSWQVGLQDPSKADQAGIGSAILMVLELDDMAVATSGNYQRFEMIEGKRFSHILDRETGVGSEGLSSVSIISERAIDADALATAVSVMGVEEGLRLVESLENTEAILIKEEQGEVIKSSGAGDYIEEITGE